MSTDIKFGKAHISKIIQSGGSFGSWLGNLGKKALTNTAIPLAKTFTWITKQVRNLTSSAINKLNRKINGKGAVKAWKRFTLFILNEDMNDIIKIIKSSKILSVLIDGVTETVKHERKKTQKTRRQIFWSFVSTFNRFNGAASNFFSSKRYKWKSS